MKARFALVLLASLGLAGCATDGAGVSGPSAAAGPPADAAFRKADFAWSTPPGKGQIEGQLVFSGTTQMLNAALAGFGLAYLPQDLAQPHLAKGRLERVLEDWCPPFPGYHLYYPSRRQSSPAFALLVEALRYRG